MNQKGNTLFKLILVAAVFALSLTIGSGFTPDLSAKDDETYKGLKLFTDVIDLIERNYVEPVDTKDLIEKAVGGMLNGLDPHSSLLTPEAFKELQIDTHGKFSGVGIHISMRNSYITVIAPIEGTPAYKAGVKAGDIIVKVDGETTDTLMDAVKRIRGPRGTEVTITVLRKGAEKPIDIPIVRDIIPIESVRAVKLKDGYGYIRITNFRDKTSEDLLEALKNLQGDETEFKGLVLDLRDDPGGLLNQAIQVSDTFLKNGTIVSIKGRNEDETKTYQAKDDNIEGDYPIVLLINGGSASASEIVAGALQDHKRALVLGTTSFGKGSVQTVETLRDGYGLKYTIARYYTPSGKSIQAQGIEPDIVVAYEIIEEKKVEEGMLKESDLKNHLEAEGNDVENTDADDNDSDDNNVPDVEKEDPTPRFFSVGSIEAEDLLVDSQVKRALEILIGIDIFNGHKKG